MLFYHIKTLTKNISLVLLIAFLGLLSPILSLTTNAQGSGAPEWINITTIRYNGVDYIDSTWDATHVYAPAGLQSLSDDQLDTNCEIFINVPGFGIEFRSTDNEGNVTGDITNAPNKAARVQLHENVKGDSFAVDGSCQKSSEEVSTTNPGNAAKWFYESGSNSLLPFFPSGDSSEQEVLGEYSFLETRDGGRVNVYAYGTEVCKSVVEVSSNTIGAASWTIRNAHSCGTNSTKGTATIALGASDTAPDPDLVVIGDGATTGNNAETCESTGLGMGWLVCGVLRILDNTIGFIVNSFIVDGLGIEFKQNPPGETPEGANQVTEKSYDNTYALWSVFRTIANIMFVIGFLVMVFGQTLGVEAYTIKKMAPRIAIAAILVQLSWVLSVEVLHWVNIIGGGIDSLLYAPFGGEAPPPPFLGGAPGGAALVLFSGTVIATGFGLIGSLAMATTIALGLLGAFATIVFRNILIFVLLITSAVAAVLWILPNTEKYAKMWWDWFIKALLVYPMIVGLIAAGKIASTIATIPSSDGGDTPGGGVIAWLMGVALYFAPYFMIPFVFKFAGGAIAAASQTVQGFSKQTGAAVKEREQPKVAKRRQDTFAGTRFSKDNFASRGYNRLGRTVGAGPGAWGRRVFRGDKGAISVKAGVAAATAAATAGEEDAIKFYQPQEKVMEALAFGDGHVEKTIKEGYSKYNDLTRRADAAEADGEIQEASRLRTEAQGAFSQAQATEDSWRYAQSAANSLPRTSSARVFAAKALMSNGRMASFGEEAYENVAQLVSRQTGAKLKTFTKTRINEETGQEETYQSVLNQDDKIEFANPSSAQAGLFKNTMNEMQFLSHSTGRFDLGGINDGAGYDLDAGWDRMSPYEIATKAKKPAFKALGAEITSVFETDADGNITIPDEKKATSALTKLIELDTVKASATGENAELINGLLKLKPEIESRLSEEARGTATSNARRYRGVDENIIAGAPDGGGEGGGE